MMKLMQRVLPRTQRRMFRCMGILADGFGHADSMRLSSCVDATGRPVPWYTYPTIEYLRQLDFSGRNVFEFGAGNSTLFWGDVAQRVVSIESDQEWWEKTIASIHDAPIEVHLETDEDAYVGFLRSQTDAFDVIVVDGIYRGRCAREAVDRLRPGGMIILDNSDWYPKTCKFLRDSGLIEVDLSGFGPINDFTWTTSVFLHRQFDIPPRSERQPLHSIGSVAVLADDDL